jgi:hypothetical protein
LERFYGSYAAIHDEESAEDAAINESKTQRIAYFGKEIKT